LPGCEPFLLKNSEQIEIFNAPAEPVIVGVSPELVQIRTDWPAKPLLTGFWVVPKDEQHRRMMKGDGLFGGSSVDRVQEFLNAGEPPAYIGWGSMLAVSPEHMTCLAVRSLRRAGLRGVVLGGWAGLSEDKLKGQPDSKELLDYAAKHVLFVATAPHEWLFPRCSAIVHHGGSGTTAAALRSGRPCVVTPCAFDQFGNGRMVETAGAGIALRQFSKVTPEALGDALVRATRDARLVARAQEVGEKLRREDGVSVTVRIIDRFITEDLVTGVWEARVGQQRRAMARLERPSLLTRLAVFCAFLCGGPASSAAAAKRSAGLH